MAVDKPVGTYPTNDENGRLFAAGKLVTGRNAASAQGRLAIRAIARTRRI